MRKCGKRPWILIGPTKEKVCCKVLLYEGQKNVVKFSSGWKLFREKNKFREGSRLLFSFSDPVTREVHVYDVRRYYE